MRLHGWLWGLVLLGVGAGGGCAAAQGVLPDPVRTPGAVNPDVRQDNISETICVRGWTRTIRPPMEYTETLKRWQIRTWFYADRRLSHYEEDHLVSLELGGAPMDARNLWPEAHEVPGGWGSYRKDELEDVLNRLVCSGRLPLVVAQRAIARNWVLAYRQYVGSPAVGEDEVDGGRGWDAGTRRSTWPEP